MDTHDSFRGQRRLRHQVALEATVVRPCGDRAAAEIVNLSIDGCCLIGAFAIGERMTVHLPRIGPLAAEIRWAFMGRAGARFVRKEPQNDAAERSPAETNALT